MGPQTFVEVIFRQDGESFQWGQMCHPVSGALIGCFGEKCVFYFLFKQQFTYSALLYSTISRLVIGWENKETHKKEIVHISFMQIVPWWTSVLQSYSANYSVCMHKRKHISPLLSIGSIINMLFFCGFLLFWASCLCWLCYHNVT